MSFSPPWTEAALTEAVADGRYIHQNGTGLPTAVVSASPNPTAETATVERRPAGTVHVTNYGAKGDGVILYNAVMTAGSAVLNSTDSYVNFSSADIGKTIIVSGVGASNEALVTTILSVQSASQCTLNATATVNSPDPASCQIAVYGTDDTAAIQAASDAAAASGMGAGTMELDAKVYIVGGALQQGGSRKANSQITLPNGVLAGAVRRLVWRGARRSAGAGPAFVPFPTATGTVIVSTLVGQSYSGTYGVPSVVGGPTHEQQTTFSGLYFDLEDVAVYTPRNPSLSAFNLEQCSSQNRRRVVAGTLEWGYPAPGQETLTIATPSHPQAAAFIDPCNSNQQNGEGITDACSTWGYFAGLAPSEHSVVSSISIKATMLPIVIRRGYGHPARIVYASVEACPYAISGWDPSQATSAAAIVPVPAGGFGYGNGLLIDSLDLEDSADSTSYNPWAVIVNHFNDANNNLTGRVRYSRWTWVAGVFTPEHALLGVPGGMTAESTFGRPDSYILGRANKSAGGDTNQGMTQGVWTAIDTANLSISFVAPPSGLVEVEIDFLCALTGTAPLDLIVGCVDGSGNYVAGTGQAVSESESSGVIRRIHSKRFVFNSTTAGQVYTWRAAYYLPTSGSGGTIYYGGDTLTGNTAWPNGPINFQIRAVGNSTIQG